MSLSLLLHYLFELNRDFGKRAEVNVIFKFIFMAGG